MSTLVVQINILRQYNAMEGTVSLLLWSRLDRFQPLNGGSGWFLQDTFSSRQDPHMPADILGNPCAGFFSSGMLFEGGRGRHRTRWFVSVQ